MLIVSAGLTASVIAWALRLTYLKNLDYIQHKRAYQERVDKHRQFLAQHNLDRANKGVNNATN